ncbi:MAG TPA: TlpA disulfide reductase family protein [Flavisolibacter sp.]|nr:TlpA disulfide reductase family protein [Flavisolibacter sp.]
MYKFLAFLLLPAISFGQTDGKEFNLKGNLKLNKTIDWVYIRYVSGGNPVTDSTQAPAGEFKFKGNIAEPTIATLIVKFAKQAGEEKAQRDYTGIFLEPGKLALTATDSLKNSKVTGTKGQADFAAIMKQQQGYEAKLNPLYDQYSQAKANKDQAGMDKAEKEIDAIENEMKEQVYGTFVKNHPTSPVAMFALRQYAGYDIDPEKIEPLFNKLPASTQKLPSAVSLKDEMEIAKKTGIGKYAMEFTQNDTLGNPVSLSSFKGKYVLVDFWASWCGPCRAENPNVVKTYQKFQNKNFTILSVSLDRPGQKERWLKAIHDDGLTWTHVSDLKFWDNAVAKQYGIRAIPQNLLLDPSGKIIGKNLRGEELAEKLGAFLN